jgi:hypothetical protein
MFEEYDAPVTNVVLFVIDDLFVISNQNLLPFSST